MNNILKIMLLGLTSLLFLFSCGEKDQSFEGEEKLKFVRYDQLLMTLDTTNIEDSFQKLHQEHPYFTDIYFQNVLPLPGYEIKSDTFYYYLKAFISDERILEIYQMIKKEFGNLSAERKEFLEAFEKAEQFFVTLQYPNIYTYIGEFSYQRFIFQDGDYDGLAIGLDLFLGDDFDYSRLEQGSNSFARYLTRSYNKEHLVSKSLDAWLEDKMGLQDGSRLIDQMLYNGKKIFLLDQMTEINDSVLLEYTPKQIQWIENNKKEMWSFYFKNDWFYTTDNYVIKRLVEPSPNSTAIGMPTSAPGRTGNYLGYEIVKAYMKRHPETSTEDLLSMDAQKLLESSKYKP